LVGLYALTLMERDGPLHGYGLSERISERTDGAWRPGPGSVYPSLRKLVGLGLARARVSDRRRIYTITPAGRALLRRMRNAGGPDSRARPDLSALWAEVFGSADVAEFLLRRLRRHLDALERQIARSGGNAGETGTLRRAVLAELASASARLAVTPGRAGRTAREARRAR